MPEAMSGSASNRLLSARPDLLEVRTLLPMAIPAHFRALALSAPPTARMRVPAEAADSVTPDAIGGRPLVVTSGAEENVAARVSSMSARGGRIVRDPAWGMGIPGAEHIGAHAAFDVAGIAGLGGVARRAASRVRLCFDRVACQEVPAMDEMTFDGLRSSPLDRKVLCRVVAHVAVCLPVARLAQASFAGREPAVTAGKVPVVTQEGLRHHTRELARVVTRHARPTFPLGLVLVT